jgi:hypothetical protein
MAVLYDALSDAAGYANLARFLPTSIRVRTVDNTSNWNTYDVGANPWISGHASLASDDSTPYGIDVFTDLDQVVRSETWSAIRDDEILGLEVLAIAAEDHWANGDVEGVRVDPETAEILARVPVSLLVPQP